MCSCSSFLRGLQLLKGSILGDEEDEAPQVYGDRYVQVRRDQPLPALLQRVVTDITAVPELCRAQAFRRSRRRFPRHFLHGTLQSSGLDEAMYYFEADDAAVVQRAFVHWHMKESLEGPAGYGHGGCLAALLDDAFGSFVNAHLRSLGRSGKAMTAFLKVDYKAPTPVPTNVVCVVTLDRIDGRKVFLQGHLLIEKENGLLKTCEATALFLELKQDWPQP